MEKTEKTTIFGIIMLIIIIISAGFSVFNSTSPQTTTLQAAGAENKNTGVKYSIISTNPLFDIAKKQLPITKITFTFNDTVDPKSLHYTITPKIDTYLKTSGNKLTIYPKNIWPDGTIEIKIENDSTSAHGKKLEFPYIYTFTVQTPI